MADDKPTAERRIEVLVPFSQALLEDAVIDSEKLMADAVEALQRNPDAFLMGFLAAADEERKR